MVVAQSQEEYDQLTKHPHVWRVTKGPAVVLEAVAAGLERGYQALTAACRSDSVLVGHSLAFPTRVYEELHGNPAITVHLSPALFRTEYAVPRVRPWCDVSPLPRWCKRTLWQLGERLLLHPPLLPRLNAWRHLRGLPAIDEVFSAWMHSPHRVLGLFPPWFGPPQPDWPAQVRLTSFLLADGEDPTVAKEVEDFLASGEPPLVFAPGSANRQAAFFFHQAVAAARRLGCRAILQTGHPEQLPSQLPPEILPVAYMPFSRVLGRCAALIHHAGIGTSAQALAAGIPQLLMPMAFDQPDNTARLVQLGVAAWLPPRRFTGARLARRLTDLLGSPQVAQACTQWARQLDGDAAGHQTCNLLEAAAPIPP